jgi:peptide/nickel transport system permease protein
MTRRLALLLATFAAIALAGPWLAPYRPDRQHRGFLHAPPMPPRIVHAGAVHAPFVYPVALADRLQQRYDEDRSRVQPLPWFDRDQQRPVFLLGADSLGRDVLSRVLHGARVSLSVALVSALCARLAGTVLGGLAGYRGGAIDEIVMRFADLVAVLPAIYIVLVLRAALPLVLAPSTIFAVMVVIFAAVGWPFVARGVRTIIMSEREREYVLASRAMGASGPAIVWRHLLPACAGYLVVQATVLLPAFMLAEATLSFAGLGFPDEMPSWGTMLADAATVNEMTRFPWMLAPALAIFLVVLSANAILQSGKISGPSSISSFPSPGSSR